MSKFRAHWRARADSPAVRLYGPGCLRGRLGGTLILEGTPEHEREAGAWSDAVSVYVLRRGGQVRWL